MEIKTNDILEQLRLHLQEQSKTMDPGLFEIHGLWQMSLQFKPNALERKFVYTVDIVQTRREGCCYVNGPRLEPPTNLMGMDSRLCNTGDSNLNIAILDAAYSALQSFPTKAMTISGMASEKALARARIIVDELYPLSQSSSSSAARRCKVTMVGAIGNVAAEIISRGYDLSITDLDPILVGKNVCGISVEDGTLRTLPNVADADIAVVTGMTLTTNTLGDILTIADANHTQVLLIAETGSWFANAYCQLFGISVIVAEPFPFYIFSGTSEIHIYRK